MVAACLVSKLQSKLTQVSLWTVKQNQLFKQHQTLASTNMWVHMSQRLKCIVLSTCCWLYMMKINKKKALK